MIEQPTRSGTTDAKAFYAVCTQCTKLLSIHGGVFPKHPWGTSPESIDCPQSNKQHSTNTQS